MLHPFIPSQINASKCASCKYEALDHTDRATCEACGNTGTCEISGPMNHPQSMLLCMDCQAAEKKAVMENQSPEKQDERARLHNEKLNNHTIERAREIDRTIKVSTDFFNAETVATVDVFTAIDADQSITNKLFAKAQFLKERVQHFHKVKTEARAILENANSRQSAIQTQLNELANKLRADEREKLKLSDLNYQPITPKQIKERIKKINKPTKKYDKASVREAAAKYKVPVDAVQMICVARNMTADEAGQMLSKQIHG